MYNNVDHFKTESPSTVVIFNFFLFVFLVLTGHEEAEDEDLQIKLEILQNLPSHQPLQKGRRNQKHRVRKPLVPEALITSLHPNLQPNRAGTDDRDWSRAIEEALHDLELSVRTLARRRKSSKKRVDRRDGPTSVTLDMDYRVEDEEDVARDIRDFAIEQEMMDIDEKTKQEKVDVRRVATSIKYKRSFR